MISFAFHVNQLVFLKQESDHIWCLQWSPDERLKAIKKRLMTKALFIARVNLIDFLFQVAFRLLLNQLGNRLLCLELGSTESERMINYTIRLNSQANESEENGRLSVPSTQSRRSPDWTMFTKWKHLRLGSAFYCPFNRLISLASDATLMKAGSNLRKRLQSISAEGQACEAGDLSTILWSKWLVDYHFCPRLETQ